MGPQRSCDGAAITAMSCDDVKIFDAVIFCAGRFLDQEFLRAKKFAREFVFANFDDLAGPLATNILASGTMTMIILFLISGR